VAEKNSKDRKMIEVKVRFWTNDIPRKGERTPRHAWSSGMVRIDASETHGLKARKAQAFNSLLDLPAAIERALLSHGIVLHTSRRMRKYVRDKGD
jgi:hypothetical protein